MDDVVIVHVAQARSTSSMTMMPTAAPVRPGDVLVLTGGDVLRDGRGRVAQFARQVAVMHVNAEDENSEIIDECERVLFLNQ